MWLPCRKVNTHITHWVMSYNTAIKSVENNKKVLILKGRFLMFIAIYLHELIILGEWISFLFKSLKIIKM